MKKFAVQIALVGCLLTVTGMAQAQHYALVEGTQEIALQAGWEKSHPDGDVLALDFGYGYFIRSGLELGAAFGYYDSDVIDFWQAGLFTEIHFDARSPFIPYAGIGVYYHNLDQAPSSDALSLDLALGGKIFLIDDLALDVGLHNLVSTEEIFRSDDEDGVDSTKTRLDVGLRFFF